MTDCKGKPADETLEAYLLGTLPEEEAERFEEHYFDCPACLAQVEALQAVSHQLRLAPRRGLRPPLVWPFRLAALGAVAALLLLSFFVFRGKQPLQPAVASAPAAPAPTPGQPASASSPSPASLSIARLADLALPPFRGSTLRGESSNPHFAAGMKDYAREDCRGAVAALSQVPADDQDSGGARFFSGLCRMHEGDFNGASKNLRALADAGDSPQQEAALYYLAQASLAADNAADARRYLARTIALRGDYERRARAQLAQLQAAKNAQ